MEQIACLRSAVVLRGRESTISRAIACDLVSSPYLSNISANSSTLRLLINSRAVRDSSCVPSELSVCVRDFCSSACQERHQACTRILCPAGQSGVMTLRGQTERHLFDDCIAFLKCCSSQHLYPSHYITPPHEYRRNEVIHMWHTYPIARIVSICRQLEVSQVWPP